MLHLPCSVELLLQDGRSEKQKQTKTQKRKQKNPTQRELAPTNQVMPDVLPLGF